MEQNETMNVKKKSWAENECPIWQWILLLVLSIALGMIFCIVAMGGFTVVQIILGIKQTALVTFIQQIVVFACLFWAMIIFIKPICKTSVWSFILGRERKVDKKAMWKISGLFGVGLFLSILVALPNLYVNPDASFGRTLFLFLLSGAIIWMQTSLEEFWFRGIIGRMFFKDDLKQKFSGKVLAYILVSSLLFMAAHLANPEVLNASGGDVIFMVLSYLIPGVMFAVLDLKFGSILPGIIVHYLNNFAATWLIRAEVSVLDTPAIFVDGTKENTGLMGFASTVAIFLPLIIYLILSSRRNKKEGDGAGA